MKIASIDCFLTIIVNWFARWQYDM